jgi:dTDP-4-dehydrorhamnose reductase
VGRGAPLKQPILVIGAGGMLGRATLQLLRARAADATGVDFPSIDLADADSVRRVVDGRCPIVINCAAYTDVDGAESSVPLARAVNAVGVGILARCCRDVGAMLVHYSTDYVFDGRASRPYAVDHPKAPAGVYGASKAEGEDLVQSSGASHLLIRTSWLYAPWGKNFVRTIARLASERPVLRVVNDQRGRPSSAEQLARSTLALIERGATGVYHSTDGGECTWYEFAGAIVSGLGLPARVEPCTTAEFPRPAPRPAYSVLDISRTESLIGARRPWTECLADVLHHLERPL